MTTHTFEIPAEPQSVLAVIERGYFKVGVDGEIVATVMLPEYLRVARHVLSDSDQFLEALARVILGAHAIGKRDGRFEAEAEFHRSQRGAFPILAEIAQHLEAVACAAERR